MNEVEILEKKRCQYKTTVLMLDLCSVL
jgi:hypothetical protein